MNKNEKLSDAIGSIDGTFINEHLDSKKTSRRSYARFGWLAAAAAAVVFFITPYGRAAAAELISIFTPKQSVTIIEGIGETATETPQVMPGDKAETAKYVIYVDGDIFKTTVDGGVMTISALADPSVSMTITQYENTDCKAKLDELAEGFSGQTREDVTPAGSSFTGAVFTDGDSFDSVYTGLYGCDDGLGGCYIAHFSCSLEAAEGFGARFAGMLSGFEIINGKYEIK